MPQSTKAADRGLYDASGGSVSSFAESLATPKAATTNAYVELHNGAVTFMIDLELDTNTYPFQVRSGTIKSGICGAPWAVTSGHLGEQIRLDATRKGQGNCANTIIIVGERQDPMSWRGTYGFNGGASSFRHTTIFHAWSLSP
ncbi:hypothetical protein [Nonomuraea sp. NPDC048826]|uniref:hypothetical protein n=1 Tax=Nonomuraea sp. NPDC048826 TaxID=3364347 RepID=UPI0037101CC5